MIIINIIIIIVCYCSSYEYIPPCPIDFSPLLLLVVEGSELEPPPVVMMMLSHMLVGHMAAPISPNDQSSELAKVPPASNSSPPPKMTSCMLGRGAISAALQELLCRKPTCG